MSNGEESQPNHCQTTQTFKTATEQRKQTCTKPKVVKLLTLPKSNEEKSQTRYCQTTQIFKTAIEQREQTCTKPRVVSPQSMIRIQIVDNT